MLKKLCLISLIILSNQYVYSAERKSTKPKEFKTYKLEKSVTLPDGAIIPAGQEAIVFDDGTSAVNRGYEVLYFDKKGNFIYSGLLGCKIIWT